MHSRSKEMLVKSRQEYLCLCIIYNRLINGFLLWLSNTSHLEIHLCVRLCTHEYNLVKLVMVSAWFLCHKPSGTLWVVWTFNFFLSNKIYGLFIHSLQVWAHSVIHYCVNILRDCTMQLDPLLSPSFRPADNVLPKHHLIHNSFIQFPAVHSLLALLCTS